MIVSRNFPKYALIQKEKEKNSYVFLALLK
jgi:hypothetical protein